MTRAHAAPSNQQVLTRLATDCAHLVNVRLGGEFRGFLAYVELHAAHLLLYSGHHGQGWCAPLGVLFVQLCCVVSTIALRSWVLGYAACYATYLSTE
jgi:hypothetical protein